MPLASGSMICSTVSAVEGTDLNALVADSRVGPPKPLYGLPTAFCMNAWTERGPTMDVLRS